MRAPAAIVGVVLAVATGGATGCAGCGPQPLGTGIPSDITCSSCHGSAENAAPPRSPTGATDTADPGVGAHQAHLHDGAVAQAVACDECHVVPATVDQKGHVYPPPAHLTTFGPLAKSAGANPYFDAATLTCKNSYCHGATLTGGSLTAPKWTVVDGTQDACGTCHGAPPPSPHPQSKDCNRCHPDTVGPDGTIDVAGGKHIDGVVELASVCTSCHGDPSAANAAPPVSLTGSTSTADVAVGAHQAHLHDGSLRKAVDCSECHQVPAMVDAPGHLGTPPATVIFGPLAKSDGLSPSWDHASATCTSVYCHGASLPGGSNTTPIWTKVDGTQDACGTCHGNPPPAPHPQDASCNVCHPQTVAADGTIDVAGGYHMNGSVERSDYHAAGWLDPTAGNFHGIAAKQGLAPCQGCHGVDLAGGAVGVSCDSCHSGWKTSCTFCHGGSDNGLGAPPVDVLGHTATTSMSVGAHSSHVTASVSAPVACSECHVVPSDALTPGHIEGLPARVVFGPRATAGGATPTWDPTSGTCADVYCHGSFTGGNTTNAPIWNQVGTGQAACGTCHGIGPATGRHATHAANGVGCGWCHVGVTDTSGSVITGPSLHVDGNVTVIVGGSYDPTTQQCTPACHGTQTW